MIPELTIALVLYNSRKRVRGCLRSLHEATTGSWAELLAVDNASPDDSAEVVRNTLPSARVIVTSSNGGFAFGANAALRSAMGRYWLLLNPDAELLTPRGCELLVSWMDAHPEIGIASAQIVDDEGRFAEPGRAFPSIPKTMLEALRLQRVMPAPVRERLLRGPYWRGGEQLDADWVPGTAMIVRADAARQVGLLDTRFFMYGEDIEWCWRFRQAGWRVGVCTRVVFRHEGSHSAERTFRPGETTRRMQAGTLAAVEAMHGPRYARAFARVTAFAHAAEAAAPRRPPGHRREMLVQARAWWSLANRKS